MSQAPKDYEHIEFNFSKPSGRRNGKSYECTAFLLVPAEIAPEVTAWVEAKAQGTEGLQSGPEMYQSLCARGALLHREDGPAYKEVEKSAFHPTESTVTVEQYWEKGTDGTSNFGDVWALSRAGWV